MARQRDPETGEEYRSRITGADLPHDDSETLPNFGLRTAIRAEPEMPEEDSATSYVARPSGTGSAPGGDVTTGWLVVVKGPGRGRAHGLGLGLNSIGRGRDNRVVLDHGDSNISERGLISITYDHRSHEFVLRDHGARNPVYLNDRMLRSEADLIANDQLRIGETDLVFIPFCTPARNWA